MKRLPLSLQNFRDIIEGNFTYVDKTRQCLKLVESGSYIFLSRPRRFGKSLLLSTLKELFQGNRELFKGLWIEDKLDWAEFSHPVIIVDGSQLAFKENVALFKQSLSDLLQRQADEYQVELKDKDPFLQFLDLIQALARKSGKKVVVLVDEYDKPIVDVLHKPDLAERNREIMRSFYGVMKSMAQELRFVMLAGVSKIAKVSIFSGLNNLVDITMRPEFNEVVGFTADEIKSHFSERLVLLGEKHGLSQEAIFEKIERLYNGYRWGGKMGIYNPFSIVHLLDSLAFDNFWFSSATPTFLTNLLKIKQVDASSLENSQLSNLSMDSYNLENLEPINLLFQTGYLTVVAEQRMEIGAIYTLDFPNEEVKISFMTYLANAFFDEGKIDTLPVAFQLKFQLASENLKDFMDNLRSLFARIPSKLHMPAERYYHSLFYMILSLMGVKVDLEKLTDKGIVDGVLELKDKVYLIEFKFAKQGTLEALADKALSQIQDRKYYESYLADPRKVILLGVAFLKKHIHLKTKTLEK